MSPPASQLNNHPIVGMVLVAQIQDKDMDQVCLDRLEVVMEPQVYYNIHKFLDPIWRINGTNKHFN